MFFNHPSLSFDLANQTVRERINESAHRGMVAEAIRGGSPRFSLVRAIRQGFGAALIGAGQRVHGGQPANAELLPDASVMSLAR